MAINKEKLLLDIKNETDALALLYKQRADNPALSKRYTVQIKAKQKRLVSLGKKLHAK